jgi:hypothetical protein
MELKSSLFHMIIGESPELSSQGGRATAEALAQEKIGVIKVVNNFVVSVYLVSGLLEVE